MTVCAEVALPVPIDQTFSYSIPSHLSPLAKRGSRVLVSFGQRMLTGIIVELREKDLSDELEIKEISEVLDEAPVYSSSFLEFTRRLSDCYSSSWGELLQVSLPSSLTLKSKTEISLTEKGRDLSLSEAFSVNEQKILDFLHKRSYSSSFLKKRLKMKNVPYVLGLLEKKGIIQIEKHVTRPRVTKELSFSGRPTQLEMDFSLDTDSMNAAKVVAQKIKKGRFSPFLLYGSLEKREAVYFFMIREVLALKKQVLFLVPEISLTKNLVSRFEKQLGEKSAVLHSRLTDQQKALEWNRIKSRKVDSVVGPRSVLFSPLDSVRLIIVDNEQDDSYYQQESPTYDARKGAWMRAEQESAVLLYGSSMPLVETFYRAAKRGYLFDLKKESKKWKVSIIEEKSEKRIISPLLREKIKINFSQNRQVLAFYNRRGYASYLSCQKCHSVPKCRNCDIALTYHKKEGKLICHYCNDSVEETAACSQCGHRMIRRKGIGIEAVEQELGALFPGHKIASFDTDAAKGRKKQEQLLLQFRKGKVDLLLGTQLLAHQVDLPKVSFAAVLFPEMLLSLSDFQASQKTFQSLAQTAEFLHNDESSELVIQTAFPEHYCIRSAASRDYEAFYEQELQYRKLMNYPPFSRMAELVFQGENLRTLARKAREFCALVRERSKDVEIIGPALAGVSKVRGRHRLQILLKAKSLEALNRALRGPLKKIRVKKAIRFFH